MKRIVSTVLILMLLIGALSVVVSATTADGSLTGPGIVRAGSTITLSFKLNGKAIEGASGTLKYDSSQLTLKSKTQKVASPWLVEFNGDKFVAYDNNLSKPINSTTTIFTVSFTVKNVKPGTKITVSVADVLATDGKADANVGTVSYSTTIKEPLSGDDTLTSLKVGNAKITPAFSPKVTSYTAEVPFSVTKLDLSAKAADGAKVTIDNPTLTPNGTTKVKITVKAENGSSRTYTISVKRAQDPDYVPGSNNTLSGITVDGFLLSPGFSVDKTEYIVWLPFETDHISVSGTASDSKASVKVEGGDALKAGEDNIVKVICTAENGEEKVYTIVAKRAASQDAKPTEPTVPETEPQTEPETEPAPTEPVILPEPPKNNNVVPFIVLSVAMLIIGIGAGILIDKKFLQA